MMKLSAEYASSVPALPTIEARRLLPLLLQGETIASLRALIGDAPERRGVLRAFDLLVLHLPRHPERQKRLKLRQRANGAELSKLLRDEVALYLTAGWSQRQVREKCPVGYGAVRKIARELQAAYLYRRGRGRKFLPETWQRILEAVKSGRTEQSIAAEFECDTEIIRKARRELGDTEDRRLRLKMTAEQIQLAEDLLRQGEQWRHVAQTLGLSPTTVILYVKYRKHTDPNAVYCYRMSKEKRDAIFEGLRRKRTCYAISRDVGVAWRTVNKLLERGGFVGASVASVASAGR
jgi:hypothetical protein